MNKTVKNSTLSGVIQSLKMIDSKNDKNLVLSQLRESKERLGNILQKDNIFFIANESRRKEILDEMKRIAEEIFSSQNKENETPANWMNDARQILKEMLENLTDVVSKTEGIEEEWGNEKWNRLIDSMLMASEALGKTYIFSAGYEVSNTIVMLLKRP